MAKIGAFDAYESQVEAVRSVLPPGKGVEIGVGTGRFAVPLGIKLGVDPSESMREVALKKGIDVVPGVAEDLPFPDESLDFVLMVTVICFFDDVPEAFKEARRVLKPGGSLIVAFIDRDSPTGRIYDANKADSAFYREATFYSAAEVKAMLEEAGFVSTSFIQTIFKDPREMMELEPVKEGTGEGVFCVVKAIKI